MRTPGRFSTATSSAESICTSGSRIVSDVPVRPDHQGDPQSHNERACKGVSTRTALLKNAGSSGMVPPSLPRDTDNPPSVSRLRSESADSISSAVTVRSSSDGATGRTCLLDGEISNGSVLRQCFFDEGRPLRVADERFKAVTRIALRASHPPLLTVCSQALTARSVKAFMAPMSTCIISNKLWAITGIITFSSSCRPAQPGQWSCRNL